MPTFAPLGNRVVNTDHIVSIEPTSDARWSVRLTNGDTVFASDDLADICCPAIPAPPGLVLVEAFLPGASEPEGTVSYAETVIVAFRLPSYAPPIPIGLLGEQALGADVTAVLQPDGQCVGQDGRWESLEAFKAGCERRVQAERAETASAEIRARAEPPAGVAPEHIGTKAEPLVELRSRILAEPIRAVSDKAPWELDSDLVTVISAVREAHPDLHAQGIGYDPKWGWKWGRDGVAKARSEMTEPNCIAQFERAIRFLSHVGHRFGRPAVANRKRSSYSWKHAAERIMGDYVSNGMLIAAAYALGFHVATEEGSPNAWINLSEKAISLDPGKGMT